MTFSLDLRSLLAPALLLPLALLGCDGGDGEGGHDDGHTHDHDSDSDGDGSDTDHGDGDCADEDRDDEFMVGLSKSGATAVVTFVSADPAPPMLGDNSWVVSITDLGGGPLEAEVTVTPVMPDHGHGTPVEAIVTASADTPGEYMITPVNLFMAGLWEITLDLDLGEASDSVVFAFCVE